MKPNEPLVDPNQPNLISDVGSGTSIFNNLKLELDMDSNLSPNHGQRNYIQASPAQDALSELFDLPAPVHDDSVSNDFMKMGDPNSLIVDLQDFLKRDPTLSSFSDNTNLAVDVTIGDSSAGNNFDFVTMTSPNSGIDIPKNFATIMVPNNSPATWTSTTPAPPPNATVIKTELHNGSNTLFVNSSSSTMTGFQPTLSALNQGTKMETNDIDLDDIGALFMKNSSPNVTLGVGPNIAAPSTIVKTEPKPYFWQPADDSSFAGSTNPWSTLSSSVPAVGVTSITTYNTSPLSDILTDLSSTTSNSTGGAQSVSPNLPSHSPSQAGPTRASTLHKLLMRKDQATRTRPSPVRSPDGSIMRGTTKTLGAIRNSLSASNPLLSQQLSTSAPVNQSYISEAALAASGSGHTRVWSRREQRQHYSSVCSVGETSTLAEEVNEVLAKVDPNDLQDIASDDEDEEQFATNDINTTDDESDLEGTSPSTSKLNTSTGSSGKKERHFWQYNVQAKGPKGQKITFETTIDDPHVLNDIVDPVFSGEVQLQGIKHSGKARRGDGNDLTANPKKLAAIGKELDQLSKVINDLTPVSEMPFGARCKSRKEKNKLASRACRLKKKAQHEANKLKCKGLHDEHNDLTLAIEKAKALLLEKADPHSTRSQKEITDEFDMVVAQVTNLQCAGQTSQFVNSMIEKHMPYV
jgi:hypothetical protein